jgi:hypothetical protein
MPLFLRRRRTCRPTFVASSIKSDFFSFRVVRKNLNAIDLLVRLYKFIAGSADRLRQLQNVCRFGFVAFIHILIVRRPWEDLKGQRAFKMRRLRLPKIDAWGRGQCGFDKPIATTVAMIPFILSSAGAAIQINFQISIRRPIDPDQGSSRQ